MKRKKLLLFSVLSVYAVLATYTTAFADPIEDILRIWQETIWNWGKRIFWFFGVGAAVVIAASPDNRRKAVYVLGGVLLFYLFPFIIDVIQQATGQPF
ncbi:hypothetical protein GWO43_27350 [candidate division KSB1 bacterium]|nr:hypothetical protein [candidate division KSB1 bacterium]NIR70500.1 hypothetical protein [candidate division KSB1 bacterium]NIS27675.1 hypothetical protein [candidate division KSB1 bacterium]NIT74510.1 hypothetical protein [candidate division KSB1 bacterium]NIU23749.1 hypothetical protein [candidate division KSB1 bacterium]